MKEQKRKEKKGKVDLVSGVEDLLASKVPGAELEVRVDGPSGDGDTVRAVVDTLADLTLALVKVSEGRDETGLADVLLTDDQELHAFPLLLAFAQLRQVAQDRSSSSGDSFLGNGLERISLEFQSIGFEGGHLGELTGEVDQDIVAEIEGLERHHH